MTVQFSNSDGDAWQVSAVQMIQNVVRNNSTIGVAEAKKDFSRRSK
jgi:hypothetical protein